MIATKSNKILRWYFENEKLEEYRLEDAKEETGFLLGSAIGFLKSTLTQEKKGVNVIDKLFVDIKGNLFNINVFFLLIE